MFKNFCDSIHFINSDDISFLDSLYQNDEQNHNSD